MAYYMDLAEMYVGDDVSPDFYGWVFPKYDHVAVGTRQSSYPHGCHWDLALTMSPALRRYTLLHAGHTAVSKAVAWPQSGSVYQEEDRWKVWLRLCTSEKKMMD